MGQRLAGDLVGDLDLPIEGAADHRHAEEGGADDVGVLAEATALALMEDILMSVPE